MTRKSNRWGAFRADSLRLELIAGLVTALALIPETISFSIVAGVDPRVGLLASFTFSVVISGVGGRPAMVSAAAGSMALVAAPLVHDHGPQYLIAATVLAGAVQIVAAALGVARLVRMLPRGAMIGFVNGLAILIFLAQLRNLVSIGVVLMVLVGVGIIFGLRVRGTRLPPTLISTVLLTATALAVGLHVPSVGSFGALPTGLPTFSAGHDGATLHTLSIIWPYSLSLAAVGLVESLLTAELIDRLTGTDSSKRREAFGQGVANVAAGFFGGQPGCAMIGQSLLCVNTGGRTRVSTLAAGAWLLLLVVVLHPLMRVMPMAALVATMVTVALTTFDWQSVMPSRLRSWPVSETLIMAVTTAVIVATSNLALGVLAGSFVALAMIAPKLRRNLRALVHTSSDGTTLRHQVSGSLYFASTGRLLDQLTNDHPETAVDIDLSRLHLWDPSAILAIDEALERRHEAGVKVSISGLRGVNHSLHDLILGPASGRRSQSE